MTLAGMMPPNLGTLLFAGLWIASILAGLLYFAPLGYQRGQPTAGGVAILVTIFLGPFGVVALLPWALADRVPQSLQDGRTADLPTRRRGLDRRIP